MTNKRFTPLALVIGAIALAALLALWLLHNAPERSDWPMWGYDDGRRGAVEMTLPDEPALLWVRELPTPKRAWPFQFEDYYTGGNPQGIGKLSFDVSYEPVVGGGRLYVPSMVSDKVTAYSTRTGEELWTFYTGGPVRFAPVYRNGQVYFVSDDGYLYNVHASSGRLQWKYKGSYARRTVLGNERFISIWPARGGPVYSDGTIYFASGVLAFEGIFIHAVCADSGERLWTNSTSGALWNLHQHGGAYSYGGPSPQGYLAVSGDNLIVPGGRTPPAVYNRHTGEFKYFRQATGTVGKGAGGYRVHAHDEWFFNHGTLYSMHDGAQHGPVPGSVLTDQAFIGAGANTLIAHSSQVRTTEVQVEDRLRRQALREQYELDSLWAGEPIDGLRTLFFKSASHLGFSRDGGRAALYRLDEQGHPDEIVWEQSHESEVWSMIPADGNLYVITEGGRIYAYGKGRGEPIVHRYRPAEHSVSPDMQRSVRNKLSQTGMNGGYGIVVEAEPDLLKALASQTDLHILALYTDEQAVHTTRVALDKAGLYGQRVAVDQGTLCELRLPPYVASMVMLQGGSSDSQTITRAYELLRPYGGALFIDDALAHNTLQDNALEDSATPEHAATPQDVAIAKVSAISGAITSPDIEQADVQTRDGYTLVTRQGPLPGSGEWTHQYGGPSNRTYSDDHRVKAPLGTLWFGGTSNLNALPRHHNGPIPQVSGGKLFVLGVETISARCVYTGRELWIREIPGIGHPFTDLDYEDRFRSGQEVYMPNHPGANFIGSPYVSVADGIYVIDRDKLLRLDPSTGQTMSEFELPELASMQHRAWGHLLVEDDMLVATADPQYFDEGEPGKSNSWNATSSSWLVVMNRHSGEVLWTRNAEKEGYRHNAIAAGNNRIYVVDGLSETAIELLQRRGHHPATRSSLLALDLKSGATLWEREDDVFGTWLGYYETTDLLMQGGRRGQRGALSDEPRDRLVTHRGETGAIVWEYGDRYSGPLGLHSDMIVPANPGQRAIDPLSGQLISQLHPITGEEYDWTYHRYYGCGTMNSSKYLIKFRSGAAGFTDLLNMGGTANLGGFRSGCTNNMVVADGVLNAPEYTRTCTCSYQLQTSFGFAHMPDTEMWTFNRLPEITTTVESLGINFGAPGNRRENGVLWLEYPKVYQPGPDAPITLKSNSLELYRNHATWIDNSHEHYPWVGSYGAMGVDHIGLDLVKCESGDAYEYDVTLYFVEPDNIQPGERVFDLVVQGQTVLKDLDIVQQAGGPRRVHQVKLPAIRVTDQLHIDFKRHEGSLPTVVAGIELVQHSPATASQHQTHPPETSALVVPDHNRFTEAAARRMIAASEGLLAPVYEPLAEQIVADYNLADLSEGIGIDLGSGPGDLVLALSERTNLHWINADINPHFFGFFFEQAQKRGMAHEVSAQFADAGRLPFRDNLADIIVSRGSYHFWDDTASGIQEIMRVLKPGGVAYVGRGFARDMPVETALSIRERQGGSMEYDRQAEADRLENLFSQLGIDSYRIELPDGPMGADEPMNYGIWFELNAPELHTLQGVVYDADSREPIAGAHIFPAGTNQGTSTNARGRFTMRLQAGVHNLTITSVGHVSKNVRVELPGESSSVLEIALQPTLIEMDDITILGKTVFPHMDTSIAREAISLAPAISRVHSADIERQGALTITDALAFIPGGLTETRGRKTSQFFSFRGQRYPYPDYAIDGVWQREFEETHYFFSALDIESIEVIRSSNALVKGLSGLSGLVDIRTRRPERESISVSARYGQQNRYSTHLRYGNKINRVSFNLSTSLFGTSGPAGRRGAERVSNIHGTADWAINSTMRLSAGATYLYGERDFVQIVPPGSPNLLNLEESFDPIHTFLSYAKLHNTWNSRSVTEFQANVAVRNATYSRYSHATGSSSSHEEDDYEYSLQVLHSYSPVSPLTLRLGGLYNHWVAPNGKRYYAGRRANIHTWSGVFTAEYRASSYILDAGFRIINGYVVEFGGFGIQGSAAGLQQVAPVRNETAPVEWQSALGATWLASGPVSVHYNLSSGSIAPRRGSITEQGASPENEIRVQHDLGIVFRQLGYTGVSASAFHTQRYNALGLSGQTATNQDQMLVELYENRNRQSYGLEVSASSAIPLLRSTLSMNATLMRSRIQTSGQMVADQQLPNIILNGSWLFTYSGLDANLFVHHTGAYKNNRFVDASWINQYGDYPLGNFYMVTFTTGYSFGSTYSARVFVELKNLLDQPFETVAAYPDPGRLIQTGFRVDV